MCAKQSKTNFLPELEPLPTFSGPFSFDVAHLDYSFDFALSVRAM